MIARHLAGISLAAHRPSHAHPLLPGSPSPARPRPPRTPGAPPPAVSPRCPGVIRPSGIGGIVLLVVLLAGCSPSSGVVAVACASRTSLVGPRAIGAGDTLEVILRFRALPRSGRVLVRVDGLGEKGVVRFRGSPPPATAAVGVALTTAEVFQGCVSRAPTGFVLEASHAPVGKAWVRVSAARPVRVRIEGASGEGGWSDAPLDEPLVVAPGESGWTAWGPGG